jgi:hypothetical protein
MTPSFRTPSPCLRHLRLFAWACAMPALSGLATAQTAPSDDAARDALKAKEGDVSPTSLLKDTLSAAEKQYSLLKTGKLALNYDLGYAYVGSEAINVKFTDSTLTLFNITNTRAHTVTNTLSADFGLRDNLTLTGAIPLISRYSQSEAFSGLSNGLGDLSIGARFQPFELRRDAPSITTTATLRLPTGRSPFKTLSGQNLATGAGYTSLTLGLNGAKVLDPVALFGSVNLGLALPAKHLSQARDGVILSEVHPGPSLGFGLGFAYALSYSVSTTLSLQETVSARTRLVFQDGSSSKTATQTSASLNMGLGLRVSPKTTLNITAGLGLTADSPDFTLSLNMPLNF